MEIKRKENRMGRITIHAFVINSSNLNRTKEDRHRAARHNKKSRNDGGRLKITIMKMKKEIIFAYSLNNTNEK